MKKLLLLSFCLVSFLGKAQVTIVEEKFEKDNYVDYRLLPKSNVMIITNGKPVGGLVAADLINNISSYDIDGNKKVLSNNLNLYGITHSNSENAILTADISSGIFKAKTVYLIDGKFIEPSKEALKDFVYRDSKKFTSKYQYILKNQKGRVDIDLEKDDIYLSVTDISTQKRETYKIEKPNLDRLVGPNFIKAKEELGYKLVLNYDETIDFVTKSISKDYTKTILYKTRYSNEGKKLNEIQFELSLKDKTFLYSLNEGGRIRRLANLPDIFGDDLSINNYYEDYKNGDIYIYGLYGDKTENLNSNAKPLGYYVFKFDKTGNKIWESINKIEHKEFNTSHGMNTVYVSLEELNGNLCFIVGLEKVKDYLSYGIVEKASGKEIKKNVMFINKFSSRINATAKFVNLNILYKGINELKGNFFNYISLIALDINPKFSDYIKTKTSNNELYFKAFFSDKGIWLTETDKDHYKVTLFKD
jgi:hypothetical protein